MPEARVDVVIPAFNATATIGDAVGSIQSQTLADLRIIVVNDGSTDDTFDAVRRLATADPRIVIIDQANLGIVDARNVGLRAASAEYIAVQDADDISTPDRLQTQVDYLDRHSSCVAVSGSAKRIDLDGNFTGHVITMPALDAVDDSWIPAREPYLMPFGTMRRSAVEAVGGYRYVDYAEDTDLYWRLRRVGDLVNLTDVVGAYRFHSGSATGGASLVNTRILAVNNQLAALSSRRLDRAEPDIVFDRARLARYRTAESLAKMFADASADLSGDQRRRFGLACAAKMLQWLEGRNLEPELADCTFIKRAFTDGPSIATDNYKELRRLYSVIGARLLYQGLVSQTLALVPPRFFVETCVRSLLRRF